MTSCNTSNKNIYLYTLANRYERVYMLGMCSTPSKLKVYRYGYEYLSGHYCGSDKDTKNCMVILLIRNLERFDTHFSDVILEVFVEYFDKYSRDLLELMMDLAVEHTMNLVHRINGDRPKRKFSKVIELSEDFLKCDSPSPSPTGSIMDQDIIEIGITELFEKKPLLPVARSNDQYVPGSTKRGFWMDRDGVWQPKAHFEEEGYVETRGGSWVKPVDEGPSMDIRRIYNHFK